MSALSAAWSRGVRVPRDLMTRPLVERGKHRLDGRGHEQSRGLPVLQKQITERADAQLVRDGHEDQVVARAVIGGA